MNTPFRQTHLGFGDTNPHFPILLGHAFRSKLTSDIPFILFPGLMSCNKPLSRQQ